MHVSACASRVFLTSLAANNMLPLRIGDVMRIFTYAADLNATPSMILSTVILEKLLDMFSLVVLLVVTLDLEAAWRRTSSWWRRSGLADLRSGTARDGAGRAGAGAAVARDVCEDEEQQIGED